MFKYTRAAINKTIDEFKLISKIFKYSYIVINFIFLTYKLITDNPNFIFYIILLAIFIVYTVFNILIDFDKKYLKVRKVTRRVFKITNLSFKFIILGTNIFCIYKNLNDFNALTIILLLLSILLWIIQVIIEIIVYVIDSKKEMFIEAIKEDLKVVRKPVEGINKFIKKIKGEEVVEEEKKDYSPLITLDGYLKRKRQKDEKNKKD
ncbi:MAG: hypothetical protein ACI31G_00435 [Bacilli bacterium]